jgi:hypothetical protein
MSTQTETLSIVQYFMRKDEIEASWARLYATDCRVAALAYGQRNRIDAEGAAYMALSEEDRARVYAWYKASRAKAA